MNDEDIVLIEYVKLSVNRTKVFKALKNDALKPTDIAEITDVHINTVSRSLKQLKEKNLVYLLNPKEKRGRLYKLTDKGKLISKELLKQEKQKN